MPNKEKTDRGQKSASKNKQAKRFGKASSQGGSKQRNKPVKKEDKYNGKNRNSNKKNLSNAHKSGKPNKKQQYRRNPRRKARR